MPSGGGKQGETVLLVGSSEQLRGETIELSRARLVAKVLPCYDSLQAAAATSHRDSLSGMVKWASSIRPRQLSYSQLDCLALLPFGIKDFDLEVWEKPL